MSSKLFELRKRLRKTFIVLCFFLLAIGSTLLVVASTLPSHLNESKAQSLTQEYEERYYEMSSESREEKELQIAALRTGKWPMRNAGILMCLVGATLLWAVVHLQLWNIDSLERLRTPKTRFGLVALASVSWLSLIPAFWLELADEYAQDDLRPHNNEMGHGVFLAMGVPLILLLWLTCSILYRYVVLKNVSLPATLWQRDCAKSRRNIALTLFYGGVFVGLGLLAILSSVYFVWSVPSELIGTYVVVSTWAGSLNCERSPDRMGAVR